ncbi:MAG: hypothetical protein KUG58_09525 [Marinosulfonomonas sp.]|nr:hypothetical protein [Marinosulfonomonas sp.]
MIARFRASFARHPVLSSGFLLALAFVVFFTVRSVTALIYWSDPTHRDQPIEGWMTPRYVVQSWQLPPEVMIEILDAGPMPGRRLTLAQIADDQGITLKDLAARITAATDAHRAASK